MSGLYVDSVTKHYGDKQVLRSVFVSCKPGEVIGLLGRNGSGKSTLLKIIFGSLTGNTKFVSIDDIKMNSLFESRNRIQYLPQDPWLPNHVRVKDIISCFCDNRISEATIIDNELIKPFLLKKIRQLSGGERRIIEIFLLVFSEAKYVLLDEPFNGLAPLHIEAIKHLIKTHSKDKGFIVTDHSYRNILDISTSVVLMDDGNTRYVTEPKELVTLGYIPFSHENTI